MHFNHRAGSPSRDALVERLRAVHLQMVDAVLTGDGLGASPTSPRTPPAAPVADRRPPAGRGGRLRRRRGRPRRCGATSASRAAAARRRCRPAWSPRCRSPPATSGSAASCCPAPTAGARGARVPAPGRRRLADRGGGRGGQRGGRAEPPRLVPGGAARAARPRPARRRPPRRPARLRPLARRGRAVRGADLRPAAPRGRDDRRRVPGRAGPAHRGRARRRASTRCCRPRRRRGRRPTLAAARSSPRACSATARSGSPRSTPTRPSSAARSRRPSSCSTSSSAATGRRPDPRGHRDGHLPAAVPRARLAPRGGALVLRGHGGADRPLRRPVRHRPGGDARVLPRAQLQHERDGGGDLRPPPHGRLPARAREGAHRASTRCRARTASASGSA